MNQLNFKRKLKSITFSKKILISHLLIYLILIITTFAIIPSTLQEIMEKNIEKELKTSIDILKNNVRATIDISIKNHLKTIAETNLIYLTYLNEKIKNKLIDIKTAKKEVLSFIKKQRIGKTGYIYIIDKQGRVLYHPDKKIIGTNVSKKEFIKKQLSGKQYIEYKWKNADESLPRKKSVYSLFFKPWNIFISVSADQSELFDLVKIEDIEAEIKNLKFGNSGYTFLLDEDGNFIIHPTMKDKNLIDIAGSKGKKFIETIIKQKQGKLEYQWQKSKDEPLKKKLLYFRYIPEFKLILCATEYKSSINTPIMKITYIILSIIITLIITLIPVTLWLSNSIINPLNQFIKKLKFASNDRVNLRIHSYSGGEIKELEKYFNLFMDDLEEQNKKLEQEIHDRKIKEEQIKILAKFPNDNPNPIIRVNNDSKIAYFNDAAKKQLKSIDLKIGTEIPENFQIPIKKALFTEKPGSFELNDCGKTFLFSISPFKDINSAYIYATETTLQKEYESLLILSDSFFENSIEGIVITDVNGKIEKINPVFSHITGYSENEVIGQNPRILKSDRHDHEFYKNMWNSLKNIGQWSGEIWNRRKNGQAYPEWLTISAIKDVDGNIKNYVGVFHDITESMLNKEKIQLQSFHDATTGLPNRRLFSDILNQTIKFKKGSKDPEFAVLFLDINNFKNINDTLSHIAGDELLYKFAKKLEDSISRDMTCARFSGDKFLILIPHIATDLIQQISLIKDMLTGPYIINKKTFFCNTNIGVAIFPDDGDAQENIIKNAELAMFRGKVEAKGKISFFMQYMNENANKRLEIEHKMRSALKNNNFQLFYQPKVNLSSGKISGAEALIRWIDGDKIISPLDFIPIAEETGFIIEIGEWVFKEACKFLNRLKELSYDEILISINISGVQFKDPNILKSIKKFIKETEVDPHFLKLEITETVAIQNPDQTILITNELKQMGFKIAIDDFGTGYSSLGYLKNFPVDELKIDKSFIDEFPESESDNAIIKAILSLASNFKFLVVAEGVETKIQADTLKILGCDEMQGYYFSKPIPENKFITLLKSGKEIKTL